MKLWAGPVSLIPKFSSSSTLQDTYCSVFVLVFKMPGGKSIWTLSTKVSSMFVPRKDSTDISIHSTVEKVVKCVNKILLFTHIFPIVLVYHPLLCSVQRYVKGPQFLGKKRLRKVFLGTWHGTLSLTTVHQFKTIRFRTFHSFERVTNPYYQLCCLSKSSP